jgi:hypothetical protein
MAKTKKFKYVTITTLDEKLALLIRKTADGCDKLTLKQARRYVQAWTAECERTSEVGQLERMFALVDPRDTTRE